MQQEDRFNFVRDECRRSADRMEAGGYLGLRMELDRLREGRARLRDAALKDLVLTGGKP